MSIDLTNQSILIDTVPESPAPARFTAFKPLLGIMVLASALWFGFLWHSGINYQEAYNLQLTAAPAHSLAANGSPDDPMPLYYLLLDGYSHVVGISLYKARILSLVCLLLSIPTAYAVGKKMSGDTRVGTVAAAFVGLSPFVLWYDSRATMYALLLLVTLINQYFFTGLLQRARWWHWTGYIISGLLALGVHFFFALLLLLQAAFLVVKHREYKKWTYLGMAGCLLWFALIFFLWAHYSLAHTTYWQTLPYTGKPSATNAFIIYVQYLFGFQSVVTTTLVISLWPLLVILGLLGVQKYVRPPVGVQYAIWAATAPIIVMFVLGWLTPRPLFLTSYLVISAAPFMLFVAWYFVAFNLRTLALARTILLIAMLGAFFIQFANASLALQEDYLGQTNASQPLRLITLPGIR